MDMNDFISAIRTDREREICHKEKVEGFLIPDKRDYTIVEEITLPREHKGLTFGVQANQREVYFFINDCGANIYLSIVDIYELLKKICDAGDDEIVFDALERIKETKITQIKNATKEVQWENRGSFSYRGVEYFLKLVNFPKREATVRMETSDIEINYCTVFELVNLIQEKSNAFFMRGVKKHTKYVNGMVRLMLCLLKKGENIEKLERKGWKYNYNKRKFELDKELIVKDQKKYYLTETEYKSIMNIES